MLAAWSGLCLILTHSTVQVLVLMHIRDSRKLVTFLFFTTGQKTQYLNVLSKPLKLSAKIFSMLSALEYFQYCLRIVYKTVRPLLFTLIIGKSLFKRKNVLSVTLMKIAKFTCR